MICFVVPDEGSFSMRGYLEGEGRALSGRMRILLYEELPALRELPLGTYVFSALDQLSPAVLELVWLACERLADAGARILNHPGRVKLRYDLLRAAHEAGINDFRAFRVPEVTGRGQRSASGSAGASLRFPVFVREENEHTGNLTPLLHTPAELEKALGPLVVRGYRPRDLLVVEFCDSSDENGVFRKYSAFIVAGHILPRHLYLSRSWMTKAGLRLFDAGGGDEELAYMEKNPHEPWLREVFRMAGIEYGRIDYGMLDGRPQVWEINTNPTIGRGPGPRKQRPPHVEEYRRRIAPVKENFYRRFTEAWERTDGPVDPGTAVELPVPAALLRKLEIERKESSRARSRRARLDRLAGQRWVRVVRRGLDPVITRVAPWLMRLGGRRS